jgi:hypothetical protein
MNEVGVKEQCKELVDYYKANPFAKSDLINIDQYVVTKSWMDSSSCSPRKSATSAPTPPHA